MFGLVSVTPRAAQWALAGDLDRQHRMMSAQNASPAAQYISFFHFEPLLPLVGVEGRESRIKNRRPKIERRHFIAIFYPRSSILDLKPALSPWYCRSFRAAPA